MSNILALALILCASAVQAGTSDPDRTVLPNVPVVNESTEEASGAAAMQSVLNYYGKELTDQEEVMEGVLTDAQGTAIEDMVSFANRNGVFSWRKSGVTVGELRQQIRDGNPVIVEIMAWSEDESSETTYADDWDNGRYAVVVGMDADNVFLMDPALTGGRGFIPVSEFEQRWHNLSSSGQREYQTAVLFNGTPKARSAWERIY